MTDLQRDDGLARWYARLDVAALQFTEDVPVDHGWPWRSALVLAVLVTWWWLK